MLEFQDGVSAMEKSIKRTQFRDLEVLGISNIINNSFVVLNSCNDDVLVQKWLDLRPRCPDGAYSVDRWHGLISGLREFLRGWGTIIWENIKERK